MILQGPPLVLEGLVQLLALRVHLSLDKLDENAEILDLLVFLFDLLVVGLLYLLELGFPELGFPLVNFILIFEQKNLGLQLYLDGIKFSHNPLSEKMILLGHEFLDSALVELFLDLELLLEHPVLVLSLLELHLGLHGLRFRRRIPLLVDF